MFFAFPCFGDAGSADFLYEVVAHVRQGGVPVHAGIVLHFNDGVLNQLFFVLAQVQQFVKILLALNELGGAEPAGDSRPLGMVLNDMAHRVDAPVYRAVGTEVLYLGLDTAAGGRKQGVHQLGDAFIFGGADGNHRNPQGLRHLPHVHAAAVAPELVHHVQGDDHGHLQAHKL